MQDRILQALSRTPGLETLSGETLAVAAAEVEAEIRGTHRSLLRPWLFLGCAGSLLILTDAGAAFVAPFEDMFAPMSMTQLPLLTEAALKFGVFST
jgi:hypothetical protein